MSFDFHAEKLCLSNEGILLQTVDFGVKEVDAITLCIKNLRCYQLKVCIDRIHFKYNKEEQTN